MLLSLLPLAGWAEAITESNFTVTDVSYGTDPVVTSTLDGANYTVDVATYKLVGSEYTATTADDLSKAGKLKCGTYYKKISGQGVYSGIVYKAFVVSPKAIEIKFTGATINFSTPTPDDATLYAHTWTAGKAPENLDEDANFLTGKTYGTSGTETDANEDGYVISATCSDTNYTMTINAESGKYVINRKSLPATATANAYEFHGDGTWTYNGVAQTGLPTFTIKDGDATLSAGTDYSVAWYKEAALTNLVEHPTAAGDYYAKVTGIGNYKDDRNVNTWKFTIAQKKAMVYVKNINTKTYDGTKVAMNADGTQIDIDASNLVFSQLATVDNNATFKANFAAHFADNALNGKTGETYNAPKDAGSYKMKAFAVNADAEANYDFTYQEFGSYTIKKRDVTVTALNQTFDYTGSEQNISTTITVSPAANATVSIEAAGAGNTGLLAGESITTGTALFAIQQKEGVTIQEVNNSAYTGAIEIVANSNPTNTNYNLVPVAGNVIVNGTALMVVAESFDKDYGYILNTADLKYMASPDVTLTKTPTYVVTNSSNQVVTAETGVLPIGTYTITITQDASLAPTNYSIAADAYYTGELTIGQKELTVVVSNQTLSVGQTEANLLQGEGYIDIQGLVNSEKVAYTIKGETGTFSTVSENAGIASAITAELMATNAPGYDAEIYSNGNYTFNVTTKGTLTVVGENTIVLNRNLTPATNGGWDDASKNTAATLIANAATACAANEALKYTVKFDAYKMIPQKWYTLVLPFETNVAEISEKFGYAVVDIFDTKNNNTDDVHFAMHMGKINANQPFIVKVVNSDIDDIEDNVDMSTVTFTQKRIVNSTDPSVQDATTGAPNRFIGVYGGKYQGFDPQVDYVFGTSADATTYQRSSTGFYIFPLSAYIKFGTVQPQSGARMIIIDEPDGSTTAINALTNEVVYSKALAKGWYTLNGVKLNAAPTTKGIYINNGKKVVIK